MARRILAYCYCFILVLGLIGAGLFLSKERRRWAPDITGDLPGKTAYFLSHAKDFDLLYLGDSRTYCALHPELLDPQLATRSINLAHWAHWPPTQYAHAKDILACIPADTTIVWSMGETNLLRNPIQDKYPIAVTDVPNYIRWGYSLDELSDNLLSFSSLGFLYAYRATLFSRARALLEAPLALSTKAVPAASPGAAAEDQVQALAARPGVARYEVQAPEGRPVAVSLFMQGGGYLLEELDPGHFRARQTSAAPKAGPLPEYTPDPSRWATFLAMLDLFRRHNARLVVNVLEEAPHTYAPDAREHIRAFMDKAVRREVEARGFVYLRADLDQLQSADYFDYNHLNARGVEKYSRLFAAALAPHLKQLRGR